VEGKILERELEYQRGVAQQRLEQLRPIPEYIIARYRDSKHWRAFPKERIFHSLKEHLNRLDKNQVTICDFGCGDGTNACEVAKVFDKTSVCAFDVSPELIEVATLRIAVNGLDKRVEVFTGDAESDLLDGKSFDITLALDVLHHVDIKEVFPRILRATRPGGLVVVFEPVSLSPVLQTIRDILPAGKDASPDERPLSQADIDFLLDQLASPTVVHHSLALRLGRFLPNRNKIDKDHPITRLLMVALGWVDAVVLGAVPIMRKFSGGIVIVGYRPS
jgi:2-polyprenyl-3-methyl-5-hydroxy-6-metoxy-1,4-benzoquinol methylase